MIHWDAALGAATTLRSRGPALATAVRAVLRSAPAFQNKAFPLSPLPLMVAEPDAAALASAAEDYVRLLDKIVRLYLDEPEVRAWYDLGDAAEALILADQRLGGCVAVCRLDGYLEQRTERPFFLENNADAPAGSMFTGRVNRLVGDLLAMLDVPVPALSPLTYDDESALLGVVTACAARAGTGPVRHLAILQPAGTVTRESEEMAAAFSRTGVDAYVADPRELRLAGGRVWFGSRPADACWNKINTASWRGLAEADGELIARWVRALAGAPFVHVNPFGARYVAESKLSLALPREPRFAALFSDAERAIVERMLPWGLRVSKEARTAGGTGSLYDDLVEHPARYVLKQPYDIRGDGVTIGRSASRGCWEDAIATAVEHGYLAQAHIPPASYLTIDPRTAAVVPMPVSLDTYVLNGRAAGFGAKASLHSKVNVFQGGQKLAVHVVKEPCHAD
ncbi:MAG TPA: hypothetical protein VNF47_01420 [Streptosporangiaceae bacterium]|nr:hypothetical protein [Streptosporangiaceae bacterium]